MAAQTQAATVPEIPSTLPTPRIAEQPMSDMQPAAKSKKKLIRRADRDYSQLVRRTFQATILLLNLWLGSIFYFWVRQFEPGGAPTSLQRPAGVEGWLPIAGLMNLR